MGFTIVHPNNYHHPTMTVHKTAYLLSAQQRLVNIRYILKLVQLPVTTATFIYYPSRQAHHSTEWQPPYLW